MQGLFRSITLASAVILPVAAQAQVLSPTSPEPVFRGIVNAAVTDGGDDLAKVQFKNASSEKIKAGSLLMLGGGVLIQPRGSAFSYQLTANYHFDSITAKNGDASFDRFPLEALVFYNNGQHRFGVGVSHHLSPEVEFDFDDFAKETVEFDDATGFVVEYNYEISERVWLGLRHTSITYEVSDINGAEVDGDHFGLTAHFAF
ncbi:MULTISPECIES: hypothetical protein [Spongiibacter]|uniref:hypothetical protein n=1 Tax=Spongiibacter TaxID=630749 RepID=UPI001B006DB6|nr:MULTISPECIES: hypothetical protein [Spongiibacter]MBO6753528.1 hypothetical protein [Spongiibacter sp.]|tara:strand:+ start:4976 stop:5581 length:606 start_codon:yes stop_codon:yes gene_type:complete